MFVIHFKWTEDNRKSLRVSKKISKLSGVLINQKNRYSQIKNIAFC